MSDDSVMLLREVLVRLAKTSLVEADRRMAEARGHLVQGDLTRAGGALRRAQDLTNDAHALAASPPLRQLGVKLDDILKDASARRASLTSLTDELREARGKS